MNCPVCKDERLLITERQGIEIDYCPKCRGVWLDRGELDKLIDKASPASTTSAEERRDEGSYRVPPPPMQSGYGTDAYGRGKHHHKKRKGMLAELFDFD